MKKLTIIIVNYNSLEFLKPSIESLIKDPKVNTLFSIIVVDNNSNLLEITKLKQYITAYTPNFDMTLTQLNENKGWAYANNRAILQSESEYVLLLNPDTIVSSDVITFMIAEFDKNPSWGAGTVGVYLPGGKLDDACHRGFPTPWRALCHFSKLSAILPKSQFFNGYHLGYRNLHKDHEIEACSGAFLFIRRKAGEDVNWIDKDYFWYGDDLDFCYTLKQKKWKIVFLPEKSILHYKGISSGIKKQTKAMSNATRETQNKAQFHRFEAMKLFYQKHYSDSYPKIFSFIVLRFISIIQYIYSGYMRSELSESTSE